MTRARLSSESGQTFTETAMIPGIRSAIIGGLTVSVILTVFLVPAAYLVIHRKEEHPPQEVRA